MAKPKSSKSKKEKTWRRYAGKTLKLGGKVAIKQLKVALGLNTESKNFDVSGTYAVTGTLAGVFAPTTGLAQGNTNITRNGNGMRITHWNVKLQIVKNILQTVDSHIRLIVAFQPRCEQGLLTPTQVLQTPTVTYSPLNSDLTGVRILYNKIIRVTSDYSGDQKIIYKEIKISPQYEDGHVQWLDSDTTGTATNLVKGYYVVYAVSNNISGGAPSISYYSRVNYVDN